MEYLARQASMHKDTVVAQANLKLEVLVPRNIVRSSTDQTNALIATIEAATRRLHCLGFEQDRLKEQRKRSRDRQFALHC